jgi:23S rRNA pseudouridine1911/1915/1917 synthase
MAKDFPRQALHAKLLAFSHPVTGEMMRFEAPMPADMTALVTGFREIELQKP